MGSTLFTGQAPGVNDASSACGGGPSPAKLAGRPLRTGTRYDPLPQMPSSQLLEDGIGVEGPFGVEPGEDPEDLVPEMERARGLEERKLVGERVVEDAPPVLMMHRIEDRPREGVLLALTTRQGLAEALRPSGLPPQQIAR